MKVLMISADGFEDLELLVPYFRFQEEGIAVDLVSPAPGTISGKHGYEARVDKTLDQVDPADYDLLVVPGGKAPAAFRRDAKALEIARSFFAADKPVAAICHGPQLLITAGLLEGRRATCYREVVPELKEAGARYEDAEVVVDGNLVTSREPKDLPAFVREMMKLAGALQPARRAA